MKSHGGNAMSKYHSLQIFKYENGDADLKEEYKNRYYGATTMRTALKITPEIRGLRQNYEYNLFLLPIPDVLKLQGIIEENSRMISSLVDDLPPIASNQFFYKTLADEITSTNDIEDVKTTDKEVNEAISNAQNNTKKDSRLQSFAKMYLKIRNRENLQINDPKDIREIFDFLLKGEIKKEKLPDGKLFRNRTVRIGNDTETVHSPKEHEQEIILDLKDWITFINNDDIPFIIKSFIGHYFFENIHPFNDGNGRTGRYILCVYLGYKLDSLSAITFSSEINKNKEKYYKAFRDVSNPNNYGEITFFVIDMMKILIKGQKNIISRMTNNKNMLTYLGNKINESISNYTAKKLLYLYAQAFLFNDSGYGIEDRELKKYTSEFHWSQVKKSINTLSNNKVLTVTKKSPLTRRLSHDYIATMIQK